MVNNPWQVDSIQAFTFLKCPECNYDTKQENDFKDHAVDNHPLSSVLFSKTLKKERFTDPLTDFEDANNTSFESPISYKLESKEFDEPDNEEEDLSYTPSDMSETNEEQKVIKPVNRHIGTLQEKDRIHQCGQCDKAFFTKSTLDHHTLVVHYKTGTKSVINNQTSIKKIAKVHEKANEYKCPNCEKIFFQKRAWHHHILSVHEKKKLHKCSFCDYFAKTTAVLKIHIENKHKNEKDNAVHEEANHLKCYECGKIFFKKPTLDKHMALVHEKKAYKCELCDKAYLTQSTLKHHISIDHDGKKSFKCSQCDYAAGSKWHLNTHVTLVHEKRKQYLCTECGKEFILKQQFDYHIANVHEEKKFQCHLCKSKFGVKARLAQHVRAVHERAYQQQCSFCPNVFQHIGNLRAHIASVHEGKKPKKRA